MLRQVSDLSFLPNLDTVAGIPTGPSMDLTQPFISQLKINGGGPIPGIGAQDSVPSFASLAMKPRKVHRSRPFQSSFYTQKPLPGSQLVLGIPVCAATVNHSPLSCIACGACSTSALARAVSGW